MSLYDDFDNIKTRATEKVAGWSSGIKLLQSQLQLKKAATTQPKREQLRRANQVLAPVIDLKSKKEDDDIYPNLSAIIFPTPKQRKSSGIPKKAQYPADLDWDFDEEYDPFWPNDYEKVVKDLRMLRDRENEQRQEEKEKKRDRKRKSRFAEAEADQSSKHSPVQMSSPLSSSNISSLNSDRDATSLSSLAANSGFAGRWNDDEEEFNPEPPQSRSSSGGGVAIAPPPSLQESSNSDSPPNVNKGPLAGISYGASSVAAKIMAKYGFKEGQGLGKKEQGMSIALQVEKTSKRGGRIIHEKEILMPPPPVPATSGPTIEGQDSHDGNSQEAKAQEPSITEIMRSPSKIVLLRNMVGPGEVDDDLEPEVKDECNSKYGDVIKVIIYEVQTQTAEEAVRIFVEFKRIESAIKAVVDLNGRFFGGRTVKAGFYDAEKFNSLQLLD
ncbi:splicing factor 45 [Chrysoperla carnea]|uniref:splicing factor 45 n=1 Tax=Chrysoperla carnea TaxID=189513 RepID=UPI001D06B600|nr:splicing factor 45 [Chrysoperla carnea]